MTKTLQPLRIFLCHASGDKGRVRELYRRLRDDGHAPWMDEESLLGGKNWYREIVAEVKQSDAVLVCLSDASVNKGGFVQREIDYALNAAAERPEGSTFIIPVKLEECSVPERLRHVQWINLFESRGYEKLLASLAEQAHGVVGSGASGEPPAPAAAEGVGAGRAFLRDLLVALLLIAGVLALKVAVGRTAMGERLRLKSEYLLHLPLSSGDMPVVIVDTRDLAPVAFEVDGQSGEATPREPLRQIIEAVAEANPKAVGVAIDFSLYKGKYVYPRDPDFFRFCLDVRQRRGVPVFLGVGRMAAASPIDWLGGEDYAPLAAHIRGPKDKSRMTSEINVAETWLPWAEEGVPSKAMSVALAESYERKSGGSPGASGPLLESLMEVFRRAGLVEGESEQRLGPGLTLKEFPVDYSKLESVEAVRTLDPAVLRHEAGRLRDKVVLIGSASLDRESDLYPVPGYERKYPSIFLHASAVYTLIDPHYRLTARGRVVLDLLLALALATAVAAARYFYRGRGAGVSRRAAGLFALLAVVALMLAGVVFARAARLMWDDFLAAPFVLLYYPSVACRLSKSWGALRRRASSLFRSHP